MAVLRSEETAWHVDTLLMSCRVLGRGIETASLACLVREIVTRGGTEIIGAYRPTLKNGQVADLYPRHGFHMIGEGIFRAEPAAAPAVPSHITVR